MKKNQKMESMKDFKRILIPVDGSISSKNAAKKAIDLARDTNIDIIALHVIQEPDEIYPEFTTMYPDAVTLMKKEGNLLLDEIKKMGSKKGVEVKTKLVIGNPDQEIIKEADKNDLIVMGFKGKSSLKEILIGSVCQKVLHHSKSSVMMIR